MNTATKKILLIEDSSTDSFIVQRILREYPASASHQIITFDTMTEAKQFIRHNNQGIELILLDLHLPDTDGGLDTFHSLKPHVENAPIIALTGMDNHEMAMELLSKGLDDFVCKGHLVDNPDLLARTIDFALCRHRQSGDSADKATKANVLSWTGDSH